MSSKRKGKSEAKEVDQKLHRFVNDAAAQRFLDIESLPFIFERGFRVESTGLTVEYIHLIHALNWRVFCHPRTQAILPWVYEFYANAKFAEGRKVFVRGEYVDYSAKAINKYFELEDYEHDDYTVSKKSLQPSELVSLVCWTSEPDWASQSKHTLRSSCLSREAKVWNLFINSSIFPTKHLNNISLYKIALIFSILRRDKINVGRLISDSLSAKIFEGKTRQLWFPTLITELCRLAGVVPSEGDLVTLVGHHITDVVISKNIKVADDDPFPKKVKPGEQTKGKEKVPTSAHKVSSSAPPPLSSSQDIMAHIEYMKDHQRRQFCYFRKSHEELHRCIDAMLKHFNIRSPNLLQDRDYEGTFDDEGYLIGDHFARINPTAPHSGETESEGPEKFDDLDDVEMDIDGKKKDDEEDNEEENSEGDDDAELSILIGNQRRKKGKLRKERHSTKIPFEQQAGNIALSCCGIACFLWTTHLQKGMGLGGKWRRPWSACGRSRPHILRSSLCAWKISARSSRRRGRAWKAR